MALLELLNVEGNDAEDSSSVTETWYCEYSDVASGYSLAYPAVGVPWNANSAYICSQIQYSRENMKYYSATNSTHNGADVVQLKATYTINYEMNEDPESPFSMKIASSGYQTYKVQAGGAWGVINRPVGWEAGTYEYKLPVLQIDMTTVFVQSTPLDDAWYGAMVGKVNDTVCLQRSRGCLLFDSFSMVPKYGPTGLMETELTLVFKALPINWNWEWRNPVQARFGTQGKLMYWQNKYSNWPNYTSDASKVNMPIWSGEVQGYGDAAYGTAGWDYRVFGSGQNAWYLYDFAELNNLFLGPSAT